MGENEQQDIYVLVTGANRFGISQLAHYYPGTSKSGLATN